MFKFFIFVSIFLCVSKINCQQSLGDPCEFEGRTGRCSLIQSCPEAIAALRQGRRPTLCFFMGVTPVACCVSSQTRTTTTPPTRGPGPATSNRCGPIPGVINKKNGQKAWDKCIDYAEVIYPCQPENIFLPNSPYRRKDTCSHNAVPLIVGGVPADRNEFPHMALLGFGDTLETAAWECGGTLISERWVITAGHCLISRQNGNVSFIRLGSPNVNARLEPDYLYNVISAVPHPEYRGTSVYNDIALLQTNKAVVFNERAIPACVHTGNPIDDNKYIATGWGAIGSGDARSTSLLKVTLEKYNLDDCSAKNPSNRRMRDGIRDTTQVCAGHRTERKDTCQGDSGGPIQVYNTGVNCTYLITGITSFGRGCGTVDQPAVYTRISAFVPWIESVVWP